MPPKLDSPVSRHPATAWQRCMLLWLIISSPAVMASSSFSDLLIVMDPDGRHYTAQQTLVSNGALMSLSMPADRITLETRFAGPEWLTFTRAHESHPDQLSLWSGSVLTRYRHGYGTGLTQPEPGIFLLHADTEHLTAQVDIDDPVHWSVTWILPSSATLLDFTDIPVSAGSAIRNLPAQPNGHTVTAGREPAFVGRWQTSGKLVTYRQDGGSLADIRIRFALAVTDETGIAPCVVTLVANDTCSPDVDGDEVPDYRDVCLPLPPEEAALLGVKPTHDSATHADRPASSAGVVAREAATGTNTGSTGNAAMGRKQALAASGSEGDPLGCSHQALIVLAGIRFQSGQSYLDVASRDVLDRVALALLRLPDKVFEIGSHTDNAGRVAHNQRLSENRADAIRHYLMLRGVGPNQVRARGYGETSPAHDNALLVGRRANRRTELRRLN